MPRGSYLSNYDPSAFLAGAAAVERQQALQAEAARQQQEIQGRKDELQQQYDLQQRNQAAKSALDSKLRVEEAAQQSLSNFRTSLPKTQFDSYQKTYDERMGIAKAALAHVSAHPADYTDGSVKALHDEVDQLTKSYQATANGYAKIDPSKEIDTTGSWQVGLPPPATLQPSPALLAEQKQKVANLSIPAQSLSEHIRHDRVTEGQQAAKAGSRLDPQTKADWNGFTKGMGYYGGFIDANPLRVPGNWNVSPYATDSNIGPPAVPGGPRPDYSGRIIRPEWIGKQYGDSAPLKENGKVVNDPDGKPVMTRVAKTLDAYTIGDDAKRNKLLNINQKFSLAAPSMIRVLTNSQFVGADGSAYAKHLINNHGNLSSVYDYDDALQTINQDINADDPNLRAAAQKVKTLLSSGAYAAPAQSSDDASTSDATDETDTTGGDE